VATCCDAGVLRLMDLATGSLRQEVPLGVGHVVSAAWSPSGQQLALDCEDGSLRIVDVVSAEVRVQVPLADSSRQRVLAWNPSSLLLMVAYTATGSLVFIDVATGRIREGSTLNGGVVAAAWSPSGRQLATSCADWRLRLVDVATGEARQELAIDGGLVWSLAWSPAGDRLAAGGADGRLRVLVLQ